MRAVSPLNLLHVVLPTITDLLMWFSMTACTPGLHPLRPSSTPSMLSSRRSSASLDQAGFSFSKKSRSVSDLSPETPGPCLHVFSTLLVCAGFAPTFFRSKPRQPPLKLVRARHDLRLEQIAAARPQHLRRMTFGARMAEEVRATDGFRQADGSKVVERVYELPIGYTPGQGESCIDVITPLRGAGSYS